MNISESLRKQMFRTWDLFRGNVIKKELDYLKKSFDEPSSVPYKQSALLAGLLDHAKHTTDYYSKGGKYPNFYDYPIIRKEDISKEYSSFLSSNYRKDQLVTVKTSGSSGTPFTVYLTREKYWRRTAEIIFFNGWLQYEIGKKHAYINAANKGKILPFLQNQIYMNSSVLKESWIKEQINLLVKKNVELLISYPSVLSALAEYCIKEGIKSSDFSLNGIIAYAEPLYRGMRELLQETFGCAVLGRYSTQEFGVVAHECFERDSYHINHANYIIEVLSIDDNRTVSLNESGRIVITDLNSYAMPLIRFDTGDIGVYSNSCKCGYTGPVLKKIDGRVLHSIYSTSGTRIDPHAVSVILKNIGGVAQYQFIQKGETEYLLKLSYHNNGDIQSFNSEKLISLLGTDAKIKVERIESISPVKSGKRPYILNEYHN